MKVYYAKDISHSKTPFLLHISSDIGISVTQFNCLVFVRRAGLRVTDHIYSAVNDDVLRENPPTTRLSVIS